MTNRKGQYFIPEPENSSSSNETEDFASASEGPETEPEQDPLASSFYSGELSPFEPQPNPFQSFLSSLLQYNSSQPPRPHGMASTSNPATNGTSSKEVKMAMPREFSGKRTDLNRFIMSCMAHLTVNKDIYQTDEKKIGFMLSLLNNGEAGAWKEQLIQEAFNEAVTSGTAEMTFGMFLKFLKRLKESFEPHNNAADALTQLRALQYKLGDNIDIHITKLRMCLARTKLDKSDGSQATIEFFTETLPLQLLQRIYGGETIPETLTRWYKKAALQEQIRRDLRQAFGNTSQKSNMQYVPRKFNFQPRRDPNAMDVDVLTAEERSELMKKGACFRCKAQGHLSRDCPNKERKFEPKKEEKKKAWKGKDLVAYVRAQMLDISEEEKGEFYAAVTNQGF